MAFCLAVLLALQTVMFSVAICGERAERFRGGNRQRGWLAGRDRTVGNRSGIWGPGYHAVSGGANG